MRYSSLNHEDIQERIESRWNYVRKDQMQFFAAEDINGTPVKVAIMFPGDAANCVRVAKTLGTMHPDETFLINIEQDKNTMQSQLIALQELGWSEEKGNLYPFRHPAQQLNLSMLKPLLGDFVVDYAFLDLCGDLNFGIVNWLKSNRKFFSEGSRIAITTMAWPGRGRSGPRIPASVEVVGQQQLFTGLIRKLEVRDNNWVTNAKVSVMEQKANDTVSLDAMLLQGIFCDWKLDPRQSYIYRNGEEVDVVETDDDNDIPEVTSRGRRPMVFLDTLLGGRRGIASASKFENWLDAVINTATGMPVEEAKQVQFDRYGDKGNVRFNPRHNLIPVKG